MSFLQIALTAVLIANVLWFGMAFRFFSLQHKSAAKILVPSSLHSSPLFLTVAASVRFLGGMNLALALLSLALIFTKALFPLPQQQALFAFIFAVAHGSQFVFNVPIARQGGRQGDAFWPVLSGPMRFIFIVDASLMVANAVLCVLFLLV
jgi:hypothetical protein